jgi:hypothetical protein
LTLLVFRRSLVALALVALVPVLFLSSTLSLAFPVENPSANRMGVAVPLVFSVAALPIAILWAAVKGLARERTSVTVAAPVAFGVLLCACFVAVAVTNYRSYFRDFRDQYSANAANTSEIAAALTRTGVPLNRIFVLDSPFWLDARNIAFAMGDVDWYVDHDVAPGAPVPPLPHGGRAVYALAAADHHRRLTLEARFPRGTYAVVHSARPGKDFALFTVPAC